MRQLAFDLAAPAAPTLDNFVPGCNAELLARLRAALATPEPVIYLWGRRASGRTHLLRGWVAAARGRGRRAAYIGAPEGPGALAPDLDGAAVDDVDTFDAAQQGALFTLLERLRARGGALVAAGSVPPAQLCLREDVTSRLAWGLVYEVQGLTDAEKARAMAERAAELGFSLPPEVTRYVLDHCERDMRSLSAMVESLDRYSMETKRPVTVALARELSQSARRPA